MALVTRTDCLNGELSGKLRMLRLPIEQAKPNMQLARSISNPAQPEHMLLQAGYTLTDQDIARLRSLRVYSIWVKYPSLDFLDNVLDPELTRQQQELYGTLKAQFSQSQEHSQARINYDLYIGQVTKLFTRLLTQNSGATTFINELYGEADDIFLHGTTVAYLAMLIGMRLEAYLVHERPRVPTRMATDLTSLGVGCLLHDIGKLQLPEELHSFHMTAENQGNALWQSHAMLGFEMVQGKLDSCAAQIVLNHHQHYDGSGFPLRQGPAELPDPMPALKGDEIHVFCRIACIADRFDGFRHLPDGRVAPQIVALKRMHNPGYYKWFDPMIFPVFVDTVPPFPLGEQVVLNNSQVAVVTELNDSLPCRPTVRPVDMSLAEQPNATDIEEEPDLCLASRTDLHIAKIGDFDITPYLY